MKHGLLQQSKLLLSTPAFQLAQWDVRQEGRGWAGLRGQQGKPWLTPILGALLTGSQSGLCLIVATAEHSYSTGVISIRAWARGDTNAGHNLSIRTRVTTCQVSNRLSNNGVDLQQQEVQKVTPATADHLFELIQSEYCMLSNFVKERDRSKIFSNPTINMLMYQYYYQYYVQCYYLTIHVNAHNYVCSLISFFTPGKNLGRLLWR